MYLIIDIRGENTKNTSIVRYATHWAALWTKSNPHDTIIFLAYEGQYTPPDIKVFTVKKEGLFQAKKKLIFKNGNEIFRCINFSDFAPYDPSIPTTSHIFDLGKWLYDNEVNANLLKRKERERKIKKLLHTSRHIIVPNFSVGHQLVELWWVEEKKIDVLPYIPFSPITPDNTILSAQRLEGIPYFLHDSTYGNESNILQLIREYRRYVTEKRGKAKLVLHGNTGKHLREITETIREQELTEYVRIVWYLTPEEQEALYNSAIGWIAIESYPTSKTNIALALSKNLPILLSNTQPYELYTEALKIHPNHLSELPKQLEILEHIPDHRREYHFPFSGEMIIDQYKRIISELS